MPKTEKGTFGKNYIVVPIVVPEILRRVISTLLPDAIMLSEKLMPLNVKTLISRCKISNILLMLNYHYAQYISKRKHENSLIMR